MMQVSFRGDGNLQGVQAIAEATGQVKGSIGNHLADPPLKPNGKLDVGKAVGQGDEIGTHFWPLEIYVILFHIMGKTLLLLIAVLSSRRSRSSIQNRKIMAKSKQLACRGACGCETPPRMGETLHWNS